MKKSFLIASLLLLVGCNQQAELSYNGQKLKVLEERCSTNPPYPCYKKVELPDGQVIEVSPDKLR